MGDMIGKRAVKGVKLSGVHENGLGLFMLHVAEL